MKIAIAGAGAMGSRFGYMLSKSGNEVFLLDTWKAHIEKINQFGLYVETETTKEFCQIPADFPEQSSGPFDLIILFTKAMQLDQMTQSIQHLFDENTAILCLSNGLGNIETIQKYSKKQPLYVGVTLWSSELEGPGHIKLTGSGSIEFQPVNWVAKNKTSQILEILNQAGLQASLSQDVILSIWKKAAFNSVLNTFCALLDCNVGQFGRSQQALKLAEDVVLEFVKIAQAKNIPLTAAAVLDTIKKVFNPKESGNHYPSMHQDLAKGRKTEIDYLNGAICKLGAELNIPTPINDLLTKMVHELEDIKEIV
jgi:2-dehydropantoate 2-reductase